MERQEWLASLMAHPGETVIADPRTFGCTAWVTPLTSGCTGSGSAAVGGTASVGGAESVRENCQNARYTNDRRQQRYHHHHEGSIAHHPASREASRHISQLQRNPLTDDEFLGVANFPSACRGHQVQSMALHFSSVAQYFAGQPRTTPLEEGSP